MNIIAPLEIARFSVGKAFARMNPTKIENGLDTTPEKQSTPSSVTMENQTQSKPKALQAAAPTSTSSLDSPLTEKFSFKLNTPIPQGVNTKIFPGMDAIAPANAHDASIKPIETATVPKTTGEFPFKLNTLIPQDANTKIVLKMDAIAKATVPDASIEQIEKATIHDTTGKFQLT